MKKVMKKGMQRRSLQRARKRRSRVLLAGSGLIAVPLLMLALQSLPQDSRTIEASPVVEKTVEDYQMEEAAREQKEAKELKASIEEYREEQQRKAEEEYKALQDSIADGSYFEEEAEYDHIDMLLNYVEAEAGNQSYQGKRLVACVILNRVDSENWPDTVEGVISQKYQFSSYWDGGMEKWSEISDSTRQAVEDELKERSYPALIYFTAGGYGAYGTPYFQVGDHYFCTE